MDVDKAYLEEEYTKLLQSLYDTVRGDYQNRHLTKDEAEELMKMLKDRLKVDDQGDGDLGWQRSSWCVGG